MKKIAISLFTYTLAILVILNCYSLICMIYPNQIFYTLTAVNFLILFILRRRIRVHSNTFVAIAIYLAVMLMLVIRGFLSYEFIFSCILPFIFTALYFDEINVMLDFWEKYTNIVTLICFISLVFFLIGTNMHIVAPTAVYSSDQVGWGNTTYKDYFHLYCEGQQVFALGYSGMRNTAIFVEGPMLTFVSCFALYYEFFLRPSNPRKRVLIPIILSIISSLSTTGLLLIVVMLYLRFYDKIKKFKIVKVLALPVVIIALAYVGIYVIQDKFVNNAYSASIRADDFIATMKCFLSDPLNGIGYNNLRGIDPFRSYVRANAGLSTGLGGILSYGGILWGIWYILPPIIAAEKYLKFHKYRNVLGFIFLYSALLVVTVVQSRILCTMCMAMSWLFIINLQKSRRHMPSGRKNHLVIESRYNMM